MKRKLEDLGCVVWVFVVVAVATLCGWLAHKAFAAPVYIPLWGSVVLGIIVGLAGFFVLCVISWLILISTSHEWDREWPDFDYPDDP